MTQEAELADHPKAAVAYFDGAIRPLADAKVSVMTHAFLYGTATFEESCSNVIEQIRIPG